MGSARWPVLAKAETGTTCYPNRLRLSYIGYVKPTYMDCPRFVR